MEQHASEKPEKQKQKMKCEEFLFGKKCINETDEAHLNDCRTTRALDGGLIQPSNPLNEQKLRALSILTNKSSGLHEGQTEK
jgi:hypothetical protein